MQAPVTSAFVVAALVVVACSTPSTPLVTPPVDAAAEIGALQAVGLHQANGTDFSGPERLAWRPDGFLTADLTLANRTGRAERFPFDLTLVRLSENGVWIPVPCFDELRADSFLCGTRQANTLRIGANETILPERQNPSEARLSFSVQWRDQPRGTYALILPLWLSDEDYPDGKPVFGVATVVSVT